MNTYDISLSSTSTNHFEVLQQIELNDHTNFSVDCSGMYDDTILLKITIDWGDGSAITLDNDLYAPDAQNKLNLLNKNIILNTPFKNEYYPSTYATFKSLSAQVLLKYSDNNYSYFVLPIRIRTYDLEESLGTLRLENTNIVDNTLEHQLLTQYNDLVEISVPRN